MLIDRKSNWYEEPLWKYFLIPAAVAVLSGVIVYWLTHWLL